MEESDVTRWLRHPQFQSKGLTLSFGIQSKDPDSKQIRGNTFPSRSTDGPIRIVDCCRCSSLSLTGCYKKSIPTKAMAGNDQWYFGTILQSDSCRWSSMFTQIFTNIPKCVLGMGSKNHILLLQIIHNHNTYFRMIFWNVHVYGTVKLKTTGPWI